MAPTLHLGDSPTDLVRGVYSAWWNGSLGNSSPPVGLAPRAIDGAANQKDSIGVALGDRQTGTRLLLQATEVGEVALSSGDLVVEAGEVGFGVVVPGDKVGGTVVFEGGDESLPGAAVSGGGGSGCGGGGR